MAPYYFTPDPRVWGPAFWQSIHSIALHYPDDPSPEFVDAAREFFHALRYLLPCPGCRIGIAKMVDAPEFELSLKSRKALFEWTVWAHNQVNKRTNKPELTPQQVMQQDYQNYLRSREKARGGVAGPGLMFAAVVAVMVLLLLLCAAIIRRRRRGRTAAVLP